jgi:microcystin-dependent protein
VLGWLTKSALPSSTVEFAITLPNDELWLADFFGALVPLMDEVSWEQHSTLTPEAMSDYWRGVLLSQLQNLERAMPAGSMIAYGATTPPDGWLSCDGASYLRDDYPGLFAVIGTDFGSVDSTHFSVPNLQNRMIYGQGAGHAFAETGGAETHTLTLAQMPIHNHPQPPGTTAYLTFVGSGGTVGYAAGSTLNTNAVTGSSGSGNSHNNMPPYLTTWYIIKT